MKCSIREIGENIKKSHFFEGSIKYDELMKEHTTMKVGGKAPLFIEPFNFMATAEVFALCSEYEVPVFKLGGGSDLIVSDDGFEGVVISTEKMNSVCFRFDSVTDKNQSYRNRKQSEDCLSELSDPVKELVSKLKITPKRVYVECDSGVKISRVTDFCAKYGITGMEQFAGLPGTVGGACYMNARCYEKNISDAIYSVDNIDLTDMDKIKSCLKEHSGKSEATIVKTYVMDSQDWSYKRSPFMDKDSFIAKVVFSCVALSLNVFDGTSAADPEMQMFIKKQNDVYIQRRILKGHFRAPSAGSVFKNNHSFGKPSGVLIDEAGLKGTALGGAQVAPWHGNFIINTGNATARDIYRLVELVERKVKEDTGFKLEPEIIFCGKGFENHS